MRNNELHKVRNVDITKIDIDRIIYLTINLIEALNKETEILNKMDVKSFSNLYEFKVELLNELEIHQQIIEKKPELLKNIEKIKIDHLKSLQSAFDEAKEKNKKRLERAILINKHIVDIIKKVVAEKIQSNTGYSKAGTYAADETMEQQMPPFNFNSVI